MPRVIGFSAQSSDSSPWSFSIVGGPSFNKAEFEDGFVRTGLADIDAENSIAVRPGVGLTFTVAPRVAIIGYGGYLINRPDIVYRDSAGTEFRNRWKADAVVISSLWLAARVAP